MAYPAFLKAKARRLRIENELTIDEIANRLAVSRSTAFGWVGGIEIARKPADGWSATAQAKGTKSMQRRYRRLRDAAYDDALLFFPHLIEIPSFRDFLVLFATEGHRRAENRVSIGNSDPALVCLAVRWMRSLSASDLVFAIQHHEDQSPENLRRFWSNLVGVEPGKITLQRKSNSGRLSGRTWRSPHGVLTATANDTYFREAMRAWTDCLRSAWLD